MLIWKNKQPFLLLIVIAGFTSFTTQIILLREFMSVFSGNELVMGVLLANWMFITGAGAYTGKFFRTGEIYRLILLQLLFGIMPFLTLIALSYTRFMFFPQGINLDLFQVFYYSFILILPFCFLSGVLYTLYAAAYSDMSGQNLIKDVYATEAGGNILGGLIFNLALIYLMNPSEYLLFLLFMNSLLILLVSWKGSIHFIQVLSALLVFLSVGLLVFTNTEEDRLRQLFRGQEILEIIESPYGRIIATATEDKVSYYENGGLLYTTHNTMVNEEYVHYVLPQIKQPDTVLIISGGLNGIIKEVLKYDVKHVDYTETNPALFQTELHELNLTDNRKQILNAVNKDPLIFIKEVNHSYDAILINLPDPSNAQINRYYTLHFLEQIKQHLNTGGILSLSLSSYGNYLEEEARLLFSSIYHTMDSVFNHITIIPGNKIFLLGSEVSTGFDFLYSLEKKRIPTSYVSHHTDTVMMKMKSSQLLASMYTDTPINTDFRPIAYYYHIKYWLSHSKLNIQHLIFVSSLIIVAAFILLSPLNFGLFSGGLAASATEFIILISFQIMFGYVYHYVGLIITAFMAGLVAGSMLLIRTISIPDKKSFMQVQSYVAIYAISIPLFMLVLKRSELVTWAIHAVVFLITLITGMVTGLHYAVASKLKSSKVQEHAAKTYGADMLGSSIGALIVAVLLIPVLGLINTGILLGAVNLLALFNLRIRKTA